MPLSFRIGVTGHRRLQHPHRVAADLTAAVDRLIEMGPGAGTTATPIELTVVSSLAEGTDRLVAWELIKRGARLEVVLPFQPHEYRIDFQNAASNDEFSQLLSRASHVVVLPADDTRDDNYFRAGIAVVDRSDVIITVWDGHRAHGHGGTAEIVKYARVQRKPLLWIQLQPGHHWVEERFGEDTDAAPLRISLLSRTAFGRLDGYNRARAPTATGAGSPPFTSASVPASLQARFGPFVEYAKPYYTRADGLSKRNQFWHRRTSDALYPIAVIAVLLAALQVLFVATNQGRPIPASQGFAVAESFSLALILGILGVATLTHWHDKWLSCRYLAERVRSSVFLAAAGVGEEVHSLRSSGLIADPSEEWLSRAFVEIWSRRPRASVDESDTGRVQRWLAEAWIDGQVVYHRHVADRTSLWERWLGRLSLLFFLLSVAAAVFHTAELYLWPERTAQWTFDGLLSYASVALPTIAAGIGAFLAHREFAQLANRSRHMVARLVEARRLLESSVTVPMVRHAAISIEQLLRGETSDWYALVRLHRLEVPM